MDLDRCDYAWAGGAEPAPAAAPPDATPPRERRLQVRAYNYWARMLGRRRFPSVADLCRGELKDIGPRAVLLDLSGGAIPGIAFIGEQLARESGLDPLTLQSLRDAPAASLIAQVAAHHQQAVAERAPSGFEAAFTDARGAALLYRGIMLPFSTDDETIDYVLAVVSWKEVAPGPAAEVVATPEARRPQRPELVLADWADGPASDSATDLADESAPALPPIDLAAEEELAPLPMLDLSGIAPRGPEYALLLIHRMGAGPVALVGEVPHDPALIAEATRRLAG